MGWVSSQQSDEEEEEESKASWEKRHGILHLLCCLKFRSSFSALLLPARLSLSFKGLFSIKGKKNHSGQWYPFVPGASWVEKSPVTDPVVWFCPGVL